MEDEDVIGKKDKYKVIEMGKISFLCMGKVCRGIVRILNKFV